MIMADGDGGIAGSGWNRDRARAECAGGHLNPAPPLATALPGSYCAFSLVGGLALLPSDKQGGGSSENG